jgi:hypothetical protein
MAEEGKLKLGKGTAFVKCRLKHLPQSEETWQADFQALPQPIMQTETHYLGMVVDQGGDLLADTTVHGRPSVNDLATLLAHACAGRSKATPAGPGSSACGVTHSGVGSSPTWPRSASGSRSRSSGGCPLSEGHTGCSCGK